MCSEHSLLQKLGVLTLAACVLAGGSVSAIPIAQAYSYDRPPECSDEIDNDRDGDIDAEDIDCLAPEDGSESRTMERPTLKLSVSDGKEFAEPNEILTYRIVVRI